MSPPLPNSPTELNSLRPNRSEEISHNTPAASQEELLQEFSRDERAALLQLAHDSIASALEKREISLVAPTAHFAEMRGAFTSLYLRGELRGCVGYVLPSKTVYQAVAETARAAAFSDNRFPPISEEEAKHLQIELSILSSAKPIRQEEIEIGRHGLLISWQGRRGLLLPQVAVEHEWNRKIFLEQTCLKAGLPADAWQQGAAIEAFTAEIFGEKSDS